MSKAQFPPEANTPYTHRAKDFEEPGNFFSIRAAACNTYRTQEGKPLMAYVETLSDRPATRLKVLEYELAKGFLQDDRENPVAAPVQPPEAAPVTPQPTNGVQVANIPIIQPPPGAQVLIPVQPPGAPQMAPAPQEPPQMVLPTGTARRTKAAVLGVQVAPPPPPPNPVPVTQFQNPSMPTMPAMAIPGLPAQVQLPSLPVAAPASPPLDLKELTERLDKIATAVNVIANKEAKQTNDFNQIVANLSGSLNEVNKTVMGVKEEVANLTSLMFYMCLGWDAIDKTKFPDYKSFQAHLRTLLPR